MDVAYDNHLVVLSNSFSFTVNDNTLGLIIAQIIADTTNGNITACSYNGVPMTVGESGQTAGKNWAMFYLVAPASGANTLAVTIDAGTALVAVSSFTGVDQSTPLDNYQTDVGDGTSRSVTVSSSAENMIVGSVQNVPGASASTCGDNAPTGTTTERACTQIGAGGASRSHSLCTNAGANGELTYSTTVNETQRLNGWNINAGVAASSSRNRSKRHLLGLM